jgi:hypothetical protein
MKNKIFAFVLMLFCVASCHPKAIVISPVAPRAAVVAEATTNTARIATKVKQEIKTVNADIKSLQIDTEKGKFLAAQMKKSGAVTIEQIEENYKNWDSANFKVQFLNASTKSIFIDSSELETAALYSKQEAEKLKVEAKDSDKTIVDLKDQAADQAGNVALGKMVKGIIYTLVAAAIIGGITKFKLI